MDYQSFFDALFELADVWCESIDPMEYSFFILCVHKHASEESNRTKNPFIKPYIYQNKEDMTKVEMKMAVECKFKGISAQESTNMQEEKKTALIPKLPKQGSSGSLSDRK